MKKLEKRAILCLMLAAVLFLGVGFFCFRFVTQGPDWAMFYANQSIYEDGHLANGNIYDVDGDLLVESDDGDFSYSDDATTRRATVHAVGDMNDNIATGALSAFRSEIAGYSPLTGTYSLGGKGNDVKLTIDDEISKVAYEALGWYDGCVGVYNYETGEILCMVSSPGFDPAYPPGKDEEESGMYLNKFLSSRMIPGSIFKLVTSAAAIETYEGLDDWSYDCDGTMEINGEEITCTHAHGTVDFEEALADSCNCGFGDLTIKVGAETMKEYVKKLGLTKSYNIDGIHNLEGSYEFPDDAALNLAWAGIGQYNDELNPCSMLVYMGAIAGDGEAAKPKLKHAAIDVTPKTGKLIEPETAQKLTRMMKKAVEDTYGEYNFPGLDIYAKSGTAEVAGREPNAWFSGFIKNDNAPYAFIVCVENGGYGSSVAGPIANKVMQAVVERVED